MSSTVKRQCDFALSSWAEHLLPAQGQLIHSSSLPGVTAENNFRRQMNAVGSEMSPHLPSEWLAELISLFLDSWAPREMNVHQTTAVRHIHQTVNPSDERDEHLMYYSSEGTI